MALEHKLTHEKKMRVRLDQGWVSLKSAKGLEVCKLVEAEKGA